MFEPDDECLEAGTKIRCWKCTRDIAVLLEPLYKGERLTATMLKGLGGRTIKAGSQCICWDCHEPWFLGLSIHTEMGWWPNPPPN